MTVSDAILYLSKVFNKIIIFYTRYSVTCTKKHQFS